MSFRLVSFHAHPDDEALLTAGTLARAVAEGHRVTLVVATAGEAGLAGQPPGPELAARRLADLLIEERADALTSYDARGGYGHPDHLQVHRVAARAAELAGTPVVLQATIDRTALLRATWLVHKLKLAPAGFAPDRLRQSYSARAEI